MRRWLLAVTLGFLAAGAARAGPVLEYTTATYTGLFSQTEGWAFQTNQAITVVALDLRNAGPDLTDAQQVRLYDSMGTTLASAVVANSDPTEGSPFPFHRVAITPVTLAAGQTYYIAQDAPGGTVQDVGATGLMTDPAITYLHPVYSFAVGTNPTTDAWSGVWGTSYFGPNFSLETAAVPEPATLGTALTLLVGGVALRHFRRARKPAD
jgi:hypothetical protein